MPDSVFTGHPLRPVGHGSSLAGVHSGGSRITAAARRFGKVLAAVFLAEALAGCAKPYISVYDADGLRAVRAWEVDFTYEAGEYEQVVNGTKDSSTRILQKGHPPLALQFRDDILFRLRDEQAVPTVIHAEEADGHILLNPLFHPLGGFGSVDVQLQDKARRLLARVRLYNGPNRPAMNDERFATYCAKILGQVIRCELPKR